MDNPLSANGDSENEEIAARYHDELARRGHRVPFSPSFLEAQPRSALEKLRVTAEEEEQVLYLYAATYSIHQTASASQLPVDKVRAIVYSPSANDRIQDYRDQMKISLLQKIEETQVVLLDSIQDPNKLADASITMLSDVFVEISSTQSNLLTSLRESHTISTVDPSELFGGEDLEYIALLRRKLALGPSATSQSEDPLPFENEPPAIDANFVEGDSVNLDPASGDSDQPTDDASGEIFVAPPSDEANDIERSEM